MGRAKQVLPFDGKALVRRAAETAAGSPCRPVVAVVGAGADRVATELAGLPVRTVVNDDWEAGIGASIRVGVRALIEAGAGLDAILILVADQPHLDVALLRTILDRFDGDHAAVIASEYGGTLGVPALFGRDRFPDLLMLADGEGAKRVIERAGARAVAVAFEAGVLDIDTPRDYANLIGAESGDAGRPAGPVD